MGNPPVSPAPLSTAHLLSKGVGSALEKLALSVCPALGACGFVPSLQGERTGTAPDGAVELRAQVFALEDPAGSEGLSLSFEATWPVSSTSVAHRHTVLAARLAAHGDTLLHQELLRTASTSIHGPWVQENAQRALERELGRGGAARFEEPARKLAKQIEGLLAP